ncbi:type IV pilin-like G/H family protein [Dapis sp. BLCC M172]|uniref:type IV pilin-like G/H family protein n=1 Tax=Dapis sp. BLCC M172 TaxID=2975281 RepID=UPI003CED2912
MSTKQSANFRNISLANFIGLIFVVVFGIPLLSFLKPTVKIACSCLPRNEAKAYIGFINKGQQAYYFEKGKLSDNIPDLGIGIKLETSNYSYKIKRINSLTVIATATTKHKNSPYYYKPIHLRFFGTRLRLPFSQRIPLGKSYLKSYSGIVYIKDGTPQSMICETDEPSLTAPDNFQSFDQCPLGSSAL